MSEHPVKDQLFISKLTVIILANLVNEKFGVNDLVRETGFSHYSLRRRLQAITNKTIRQFIREVRLQKAMEMLENEEVNISEVAYKTGFGSPAYFNTCFHEFFGFPPGAVKKGDYVTKVGSDIFSQKQKQKKAFKPVYLLLTSGILVLIVLASLISYFFFLKSSGDSNIAENITDKLTADLTAYDFYRRGREEYGKYEIYKGNLEAVTKAEVLYRRALHYDSTFAQAYTGLASIYWDKHYLKEYFSDDFMDSVLILCDMALSFDNQLAEAYTLKGIYYSETGKPEQAVKEYDKAIKISPNDWVAYHGKGEFFYETDWINYIKYLQEAASINHGPELPTLLSNIGYAYSSAGIHEKAKQYIHDKLNLDGDSAGYYAEMARFEDWLGNLNKSIEFGLQGYAIDSSNATILVILGNSFAGVGQYEESLKYFKKWIEKSEILGDGWVKHSMHRLGYVYYRNGNKEAAEHYFNEQMNYCIKSIELGRKYAQMFYAYYDLAGIYAFRGEKDKAYENLRIFNRKQSMSSWMVSLIKTDPLFNSIRNEPEFQQITRDVETKYQEEHERVKRWLEEQAIMYEKL